MRFGSAIALLAAASLAPCAQARVHRAAPALPNAACNFAFAGDGCGAQIVGASFQRDPMHFSAYATGYDPVLISAGGEAGKTRAQALDDAVAGTGAFVGKQINFNRPGVDYPVGYNPATLVNASAASLPTGCSYQITGGGVNGTSPRIYCTGNIGSALIQNIDFTNGGANCVTLEIQNATGSLTVDNFKMEYRGNCLGVYPHGQNAWLVNAFAPGGSFTALTLRDFEMDGRPPDCVTCLSNPLNADIQDGVQNSGHTLTLSYFAAINNTGRIVNGGNTSATAPSFNLAVNHFYIEGISMGCIAYGQHGESDAINVFASSTGNTQGWDYGVFVVPATSPFYPHLSLFQDQGCLTAPIYWGGSQTGASWSNHEGHVLSIINRPASGATNASAATIEASYFNFPNSTDLYVHDIWADPHGADQCAINAGGGISGQGAISPTFSNVVDLYDGSLVTGFDNGSPCNGHGTP